MKIMTLNIRCCLKGDGINIFDNRKGLILSAIEEEKPDIIGFQEVKPIIRDFLTKYLSDYTIVGRMRSDNKWFEEGVYIAFRKDAFELNSLHTYWLSPTPNVKASRYEGQSEYPRIVADALITRKNDRMTLRIVNTHLDHIGEEARLLGMKQILSALSKEEEKVSPIFIMGDFNASPESETIRCIKEYKGICFKDLTESIPVTSHEFGRSKSKIDYIFADKETAQAFTECHAMDTVSEGGIYISDHYPVLVTLTL